MTTTSQTSAARLLALGAVAGLLASAAVGPVDRFLGGFIGPRTRRRERRVRRGSPHDVAGPRLLETLAGRRLSRRERQRSQAGFAVAYGIGWGLVYAAVRRRLPAAARYGGLPFAVPFYAVCDGVIAPLLGLTPTPRRVPWPFNAKELANHAAWTATAELVNRQGRRLLS